MLIRHKHKNRLKTKGIAIGIKNDIVKYEKYVSILLIPSSMAKGSQ